MYLLACYFLLTGLDLTEPKYARSPTGTHKDKAAMRIPACRYGSHKLLLYRDSLGLERLQQDKILRRAAAGRGCGTLHDALRRVRKEFEMRKKLESGCVLECSLSSRGKNFRVLVPESVARAHWWPAQHVMLQYSSLYTLGYSVATADLYHHHI